jgi:RNA polymerase sigma-70 factor (ECF subfamily)
LCGRQTVHQLAFHYLHQPLQGPGEKTFKKEQETAVRNALATLKDKWRIPLILYYYREFSLAEISEMLEIPGGTVKSRLAAGRRHLKKIMEVTDNERK